MALCGSKPKTWDVEDHIRGTIYGNCIGDAIGLLTEFMIKKEAEKYYGKHKGKLEYKHKVPDMHRSRWEDGDWTDDSDQMILIMDSIMDNNGKVDYVDYGAKVLKWAREGFQELGDLGGMGLGATTNQVLRHPKYLEDPHVAAEDIWKRTGCRVAPNGAAMRTSVLGAYQYHNLEAVKENAVKFCKITHADPRCQATVVAITTAIALMLQRPPSMLKSSGSYDIEKIIDKAFEQAKTCLEGAEDVEDGTEETLRWYMYVQDITELKLDEHGKIGYTYKALGAGFWALRQKDFRKAMETLIFEAGDADTNGAVAGALLGCKLGASGLTHSWLKGLVHKKWLDKRIKRFLKMVNSGEKHDDHKETENERPETDVNAMNAPNENASASVPNVGQEPGQSASQQAVSQCTGDSEQKKKESSEADVNAANKADSPGASNVEEQPSQSDSQQAVSQSTGDPEETKKESPEADVNAPNKADSPGASNVEEQPSQSGSQQIDNKVTVHF